MPLTAYTGAVRHGQGGHLPPGNVQMGICNPSPEFLTVFVVGLSRISGVVPTYLRVKMFMSFTFNSIDIFLCFTTMWQLQLCSQ